nr:4-alpha-glucanotransferase [Treponema sp.]
ADEELTKFIKANPWIKTYAVYKNLKWNYMQASWKSWLESDKKKSEEEIMQLWNKMAFKKEHLFYAWLQMIASKQFSDAVAYVHKKGILLKGDMPILMNEDSCDAWAYPQYFNQNLRAGSPADGENLSGQNWGFPTYNWKNLKADGYSWWKNRLISAGQYYDAYRLDHILGFFRIWAIPTEDCNALTGHTEPYAPIKREELYELGFDDNRIRWISQPHISTGLIEEITWNHEAAHKILSLFCTKLEGEELWLFKSDVKGSGQIARCDFGELCTKDAADRIKCVLIRKWSDRTLLEIAKNKFVPLWTYGGSTSWQSLSQQEKDSLSSLFDQLRQKEEKLWKKQADDIFTELTSAVKMIPCGEDLGVGIACVPDTMKEHQILGLRVVRWCREWSEEGQPFIPFEEYEPLSVTTSSVHDSSTIRQWWDEEKESAKAFVSANLKAFNTQEEKAAEVASGIFTPELAEAVMKASASSASYWFISPLQDFLYMKKEYWLEKSADERINVPGTVNAFNWTYRLPCSIEKLIEDKELQEKIKEVGEAR